MTPQTTPALPPLTAHREGVAAALLAAAEADAIAAEWAALADDCIEPNPFYTPALLLPALRAFAERDVRLAIVRDAEGTLLLLAPVAPLRGYSRLPLRYLATWMHPHCYFAAPLVRRGSESLAFAALFDLVESEGAFFRLRHLAADGPLFGAASAAAKDAGRLMAASARYDRAALRAGHETDDYLRESLSGKKRKELRRLRARLESEGAIAFETLADERALADWIADFLTLESSGWKGRAGTALASDVAGRAFFAQALENAFARGALRFSRLTHGGRPIAMIVNFIERGDIYSFKIAHDEEFARYSPGVMLEIELMRALEKEPGFSFIDSCAAGDHKMINSLWRGRRAIAALNISGGGAAHKAIFRLLTGLERAGEKLRGQNDNAAAKEPADGDI